MISICSIQFNLNGVLDSVRIMTFIIPKIKDQGGSRKAKGLCKCFSSFSLKCSENV